MSYETLVEQIHSAPEECLDEISNFIGYVIFRHAQSQKLKTEENESSLEKTFALAKTLPHFAAHEKWTRSEAYERDM